MTARLVLSSLPMLACALTACQNGGRPTPEAPREPTSVQMRLDYGGAESILDAMEQDALAEADVDAVLRVDGVRGMVKNVTRFVPGVGVPVGGDNDRFFQLSDVWKQRRRLRRLVAGIRADESRTVRDVLSLLAPYQPGIGPLGVRVYFVAGGVSDGFVFEDDPAAFYINVARAGGDPQEILANVLHEAYHVVQIAAQKRSGTFVAWITDESMPPVQRLLAGTLLEGTATWVADPDRLQAGFGHLRAARSRYRRAASPERIAENFAVFDQVLAQLRRGEITWQEASRRGFSGSPEDEERFYFVGYQMAKAIEQFCGRQCIGQLFEEPAVEFFRRYVSLCREHPENQIPGRFAEETARYLESLSAG